MPNFLLMILATSVAANAAGFAWLFAARPRLPGEEWRPSLGWIVGLLLGIYVGCAILGEWPSWPPSEDRHRLLLLLLPLTAAAEAIISLTKSRGLTWLLRGLVAVSIALTLLHGTTYLTDLAGPNSAEWTNFEAVAILLAIALSIVGVWFALVRLQEQTSDQTVSSILILANLAAGLTVVMSGYLRGGLLGLPWTGALVGATVASLWAPNQQLRGNFIGIGLLGPAAVLLVGRFFGALSTSAGLVIFLAPLLAWLAEVPAIKQRTQSWRFGSRLALVALPLVVVLVLTGIKFMRAMADDPLGS